MRHLEETERVKDFSDHYKLLISELYLKSIIDKRFNKLSFININIKFWEKIISKKELPKILKFLKDSNIIECDNIYSPGIKSKGYRLSEFARMGKWKSTPFKDKKLTAKMENANAITKASLKGGYRVAMQWSDSLRLDEVRAKKYVYNHFKSNDGLFQSAMIAIKNFNYNKFCSVDSLGNRLHTNLTNFSSHLRKFIDIGNQKLYLCDIKNSQPLFLYVAMKERNVPKLELELYRTLVEEGRFYEYLSEKLCVDISSDDARKKFKKKVFGSLLFDKNRTKLSKLEVIFSESFPNIFREIRDIKRIKHNRLAILLQNIESSFIFGLIEKLDTMFKGQTPLVTIHDAICSTKEYIEDIKNSMYNYAKQLYGINMSSSICLF